MFVTNSREHIHFEFWLQTFQFCNVKVYGKHSEYHMILESFFVTQIREHLTLESGRKFMLPTFENTKFGVFVTNILILQLCCTLQITQILESSVLHKLENNYSRVQLKKIMLLTLEYTNKLRFGQFQKYTFQRTCKSRVCEQLCYKFYRTHIF